jgi:hypothetical protein
MIGLQLTSLQLTSLQLTSLRAYSLQSLRAYSLQSLRAYSLRAYVRTSLQLTSLQLTAYELTAYKPNVRPSVVAPCYKRAPRGALHGCNFFDDGRCLVEEGCPLVVPFGHWPLTAVTLDGTCMRGCIRQWQPSSSSCSWSACGCSLRHPWRRPLVQAGPHVASHHRCVLKLATLPRSTLRDRAAFDLHQSRAHGAHWYHHSGAHGRYRDTRQRHRRHHSNEGKRSAGDRSMVQCFRPSPWLRSSEH